MTVPGVPAVPCPYPGTHPLYPGYGPVPVPGVQGYGGTHTTHASTPRTLELCFLSAPVGSGRQCARYTRRLGVSKGTRGTVDTYDIVRACRHELVLACRSLGSWWLGESCQVCWHAMPWPVGAGMPCHTRWHESPWPVGAGVSCQVRWHASPVRSGAYAYCQRERQSVTGRVILASARRAVSRSVFARARRPPIGYRTRGHACIVRENKHIREDSVSAQSQRRGRFPLTPRLEIAAGRSKGGTDTPTDFLKKRRAYRFR